MKRFCLFAFLCLATAVCFAQPKPTELDKSPLDVSYCPANYPILKMNGKSTDVPVARVIYSRPQKANRTIFGGIVKYNELWRLGANEATEIEVFKPVKINGKTLPKGRYSMFCIPTETKWTIIFNSEKDVWGLTYNSKKDVLRVDVPVEKNTENVEAYTMYFDTVAKGYHLIIMWDNAMAKIPMQP
jgi:hypothetical protein